MNLNTKSKKSSLFNFDFMPFYKRGLEFGMQWKER